MQEKPAFYGAELLYRSQEAGSLQFTRLFKFPGVKDLHPCTLQEGSLAHFAVGYEGGCVLSTGLMQMVMFSHVLSVSHVDC